MQIHALLVEMLAVIAVYMHMPKSLSCFCSCSCSCAFLCGSFFVSFALALAVVIAFALVVVLLSWDALLHVRWDEPLLLAAAKKKELIIR